MKKIIYLKSSVNKVDNRSRYFSLGFIIIGLTLITLAVWPIISFDLVITPRFNSLVKPIPDSVLVKTPKSTFGKNRLLTNQNNNIVIAKDAEGEVNNDYTKASIWFPKKPAIVVKDEETVAYFLAIPKLKIKEAKVIVGSDDLNKSLIQYGGTAKPGDYGNTVIFGHSVLPYFFNPTNYKTIFSTLPSLSEGDEIFITVEGIKYRYVVEEMHVVGPDDISVLEQRYDDSYLSLVTCVPPGTYERRLWVKARLQKI